MEWCQVVALKIWISPLSGVQLPETLENQILYAGQVLLINKPNEASYFE